MIFKKHHEEIMMLLSQFPPPPSTPQFAKLLPETAVSGS
jgi:hypothetical protein